MARGMTQDAFLDFLIRELYISYCSDDQKKKIISYLMGERNTVEVVPHFQKSYFPYGFLATIEDQFRSEFGEMAKRAYRLLGRMCPDRLIYNKEYEKHAFRTYKAAGMDETFVFKAISYKIHQHLRFPAYELEQIRKEMEGSRKDLSDLAEAFRCYEELIDKKIRMEETKRKQESVDFLVLKAFGMVWFDQDKEKAREYRRMTERAIFAVLKAAYGHRGLRMIKELGLFSEETNELYQDVKADDLGTSKTDQENVLMGISYVFYQKSERIEDVLKLCMMMMGPHRYCDSLRLSFRTVYERVNQIKLPISEKVKLAASSCFLSNCPAMEQFDKICVQAAAWLTECYEHDRDVVLELYQEFSKENMVEAFPLLAILMREESFMKEAEVDNKVIGYFEMHSGLSFFYKGNQIGDYSLLQKERLDLNELEFRIRKKGRSYQELIAVCAIMFDYSLSARNVFRLLIAREFIWNYQSYFAGMEGFSKREPVKDKNSQETIAYYFERLAGNAGIPLVLRTYAEKGRGNQWKGFTLFAKAHREEAEAVFCEVRDTQTDNIMNFVEAFYTEDIGMSQEALVLTMENRLKTVVNAMEEFIKNRESEVRSYVEALKKSKNKNTREAVVRLIKLWDDEKIAGKLNEITELEKLTELVKEMYVPKNRSKIPYVDQLDLTGVKLQNSEKKADAILLEFYLSEYMLLKEVYSIKTCEKIREFLDETSLHQLVKDIYVQWLRDGADTKVKNLLIPYAISADVSDVTELKKQIDQWTENSRGALAAFAVSALAFNRSDLSLLIIDGISKKSKNKQVRAAAENAMEKAAATLEITKEALGDLIIPNLGFNRNRERIFDYGSRTFKGVLTEKLEVFVYDETGKQLKNLPKPGAKDDQTLATAEAAAFKDLKKQLKTVVNNQKVRLEEAVITGRRWTRTQWEKLFVDNPVMNGFAIGLIWEEVDEAGVILGTFRYMEDGSFNSPEEEEYELRDDSEILLLHPLDIPKKLLETWKNQLEDYEVKQPILQLTMPVYQLTEEELDEKHLARYESAQVYFGTIRGVMDKYSWNRTSVVDGGCYEGYYYEDTASGIGIQMTFDFLYVGMVSDETVKVGYLEFYKKGTIEYGSYTYDEITDENRILPREVPAKLLSFALMIGDLIAQKAI